MSVRGGLERQAYLLYNQWHFLLFANPSFRYLAATSAKYDVRLHHALWTGRKDRNSLRLTMSQSLTLCVSSDKCFFKSLPYPLWFHDVVPLLLRLLIRSNGSCCSPKGGADRSAEKPIGGLLLRQRPSRSSLSGRIDRTESRAFDILRSETEPRPIAIFPLTSQTPCME